MSRALRGHAEVRGAAPQRKKLQHLCRYITRPAIAHDKPDTGTYRCKLLRTERLKRNRAGDVVWQLKTPYQDGKTHIGMSPLEFMQRLTALVPRPRLHLI
jgi:Putative transposase